MKYSKKVGLVAGGVFAGLCANVIASLKWIKIKKIPVCFKSLPSNLEGLRILHITDIHNTSTRNVDLPIWEKIFKEDFDIAFITGDITKKYFEQCLPLKDGFKKLSKWVPVFFVDGNHEKMHFHEMKNFMEECGIVVLDNKKFKLDVNGTNLEIIGLRDYYYEEYHGFEHFKQLMENEDRSGFRILLSHQPQIIKQLYHFQDIFVISGHTHGGQIRLPVFPVPFAPGQGFLPKYARGLYAVGGCKLYVSSGLGASRIPVRFFNRPEITILTLTKEKEQ